VIAKRDTVAAELGVDEIQVIMTRVRAAAGGHAGRLSVWVADDDPYLGAPNPSPLSKAEQFSVWEPIPFGRDARGRRILLYLMWQSMFFGGLPRRGKTFAQRLPSAAGVLDPHVRHYVADGKGGADWRPMRAVAHRLVIGAEDEAIAQFLAMLDELITEMGRRFAVLGTLPTSVCPEGKLTPEISRRYDMPVIFITIDELQEYLSAMPAPLKEETVEKLARLARRAPAAGFILNAASQRPDADSVPAKLREIITYRYCTQVVDRTSSDMVLGKGKAAQGADASILSEDHKGVGVLVTGPGSFEIVRCDYMDLPTFATVCAHGRALRVAAGTLSGDAATDAVAVAEAAGVQIPSVLADVLYAMHGVERMHTSTLLSRLTNMDEDTYGEFTPERLAEELEHAGVQRSGRQVKVDGINLAGYRRADLEAAIPPGATLPATPRSVTEGDG
jgi:DNA segregation ATPase FtsK/SpoIIIE, S-DNA-T family